MAIWTTNLLCWPQWTQPRQSWEVARRSTVKFSCRSSGWEGEAGGKDGTQRWGKGQTFYGPGSKYKIDTTKPVTDMIVKVTLRQKSRCHEECCTNHELERIVAVDKDCLWGCQRRTKMVQCSIWCFKVSRTQEYCTDRTYNFKQSKVMRLWTTVLAETLSCWSMPYDLL